VKREKKGKKKGGKKEACASPFWLHKKKRKKENLPVRCEFRRLRSRWERRKKNVLPACIASAERRDSHLLGGRKKKDRQHEKKKGGGVAASTVSEKGQKRGQGVGRSSHRFCSFRRGNLTEEEKRRSANLRIKTPLRSPPLCRKGGEKEMGKESASQTTNPSKQCGKRIKFQVEE